MPFTDLAHVLHIKPLSSSDKSLSLICWYSSAPAPTQVGRHPSLFFSIPYVTRIGQRSHMPSVYNHFDPYPLFHLYTDRMLGLSRVLVMYENLLLVI